MHGKLISTECVFKSRMYSGEVTPTTFDDISRYQHAITVAGATPTRLSSGLWVWGFDGNDYISLGSSTALQGFTAKTVIMWYKAGGFTGTPRYLYYGSYWAPLYGDLIDLLAGGNIIDMVIKNTAGTAVGGRFDHDIDTWTQFGYCWDGTTVTYYKNGVAGTAGVSAPDAFSGTLACSAYDKVLGCRQEVGRDYWYDGELGEVRIYSRALSAEEIADIFDKDRKQYGV